MGAGLSWLHLGCDDSDPGGGSTSAGGGSAGAEANALAAATSIGANGGSGGTEGDSGSGGSGGSAGSSGSSGGMGGSGADGGASSAGGSAGAGVALDGDPRCAGRALGSVCLGHFLTTCDDVDDDGWVDFEQANCAPGVCDAAEPSCQPGKAGESCADPIVVLATGFVLRGADFASDFAGDIDLSDESCYYGDPDSSDAVFEVTLEAGETLSVTQTGKLPAVLALQTRCGGDQACSESDDSNGGLTLEHTASETETVFVVLDASEATPATSDYALHIDVDSTCGNAIFEGGEDCDDGNTQTGDGCSATCATEFPYECSQTSPSLCQVPPSLGTLGPDETLEHEEGAFGEDDRLVFTFTLTERVLLDITAISHTSNTGDINFRLYGDWNTIVISGRQSGDEEYLDEPFEPGTYAIEFWAAADLPDGFTFTITSHEIVCGDSSVAVGFEECDNGGDEGCEDCSVAFGWDCGVASPSECSRVTRIGSTYGAGDPIEDKVVESAVPGYSSEYWMIEFVDNVELSGTAIGPETPDLWTFETATLRSEHQVEHSEYIYSGAFGPWSVAPGVYVLELFTYTSLPDGYTLRLSTTEP